MNEVVDRAKERDKNGYLEVLRSIDKHSELLITLINTFAATCVTDKIEPMCEFYKYLVDYQQKKSVVILNSMCKHVYKCCEELPFRHDMVNEVDVLGLLHRKQRNVGELDDLREVLNEDIIGLFDILWDMMIKGTSSSGLRACSCVAIVKHIIEKVPSKELYKKDLLITKEKLDAYDLIINFLSLFLECFQVDDAIAKYLKLCRELFLYKCRLRDRPWRANFIYCSVYVLSRRMLTYIPTEYQQEDIVDQLKKKSYAYLNVITRVDAHLIDEVRSTKTNLKAPIYYSKAINIMDGGCAFLNTVERKPSVVVNKN